MKTNDQNLIYSISITNKISIYLFSADKLKHKQMVDKFQLKLLI